MFAVRITTEKRKPAQGSRHWIALAEERSADDKGTSAVEFALIAPVLVLLLLGYGRHRHGDLRQFRPQCGGVRSGAIRDRQCVGREYGSNEPQLASSLASIASAYSISAVSINAAHQRQQRIDRHWDRRCGGDDRRIGESGHKITTARLQCRAGRRPGGRASPPGRPAQAARLAGKFVTIKAWTNFTSIFGSNSYDPVRRPSRPRPWCRRSDARVRKGDGADACCAARAMRSCESGAAAIEFALDVTAVLRPDVRGCRVRAVRVDDRGGAGDGDRGGQMHRLDAGRLLGERNLQPSSRRLIHPVGGAEVGC